MKLFEMFNYQLTLKNFYFLVHFFSYNDQFYLNYDKEEIMFEM